LEDNIPVLGGITAAVSIAFTFGIIYRQMKLLLVVTPNSSTSYYSFCRRTSLISIFQWGIVLMLFSPDNPLTASFLTADEKRAVVNRIRENGTGMENPYFKQP
jgi:hypothetical protein